MHRTTVLTALAFAASLLTAAPASAAPAPAGWEPAPTAPFDAPAGTRCDAPVHGEPLVDEVVRKVLATHPDGSPSEIAYKGALLIRVTNTRTGAYTDVDAGGSALVDHRTDGSQRWHAVGPVLLGVGAHQGNLPRGEYRVDGVYTLDIAADGYRTLRMHHGSVDDVCALIE
ncbi:hypothetical protein [Streptomyces sp. NPDC059783]|uniref:hypothetical protein n=1 Tax=Streptomyces sp. NPDC059783 TaxID=3346944 RepID=UPI0036464356